LLSCCLAALAALAVFSFAFSRNKSKRRKRCYGFPFWPLTLSRSR
jgi:hypothetical protein